MRPLLVLVLSASLLSAPDVSNADEYQLAGASPAGLLVLGLVVVDVGATVANGFALSNGLASKPNGYFSIGAGVVSYGIAAAAYATSDDYDNGQFALIMGTAGTAALVSGILVLRQANGRGDDGNVLSRIRALPTVISDGGGGSAVGIQLKIKF